MKRCPYCAEEIQDQAIKCRFCGSVLSGPEVAPLPPAMGGRPPGPAAAMIPAGAPSPMEPAKVLFEGVPSWKAKFWRHVAATALVIGGVVLSIVLLSKFADQKLYALGGVVVSALGALWFFGLQMTRRSQRIRITTQTIDIERGIFGRSITTVQLWRVRDIDFDQSFVERLLGIARIQITSHDAEHPTLLLFGMPGRRQLFLDLRDAIAIARQSRNVVGVVD